MNTTRITIQSLLALLLVSSLLFGVTSCFQQIQDHRFPNPTAFSAAQGPPFAAGLNFPIGLTEDNKGNVWVTEVGSGTVNNGQVSVITPTGTFPVITGFKSGISPENSPEGLNHLLYKDGKLYILHGTDEALYIVDVSTFVPGTSAPISASSPLLTKIDIGPFVRKAHPNAPDEEHSNPFNLAFGPNGDLFITDSGANAIIRWAKSNGELSVYAVFPDITGPLSGDVVPTGIIFDGTKFWVSSLTGAPFVNGVARIYQVTPSGNTGVVTEYKSGFTGMTDIALTPGGKPIVTEFGFSGTGRLANGDDATVSLFTPAITPVDILASTTNADTYYILYYGPGLIIKITATN
ncbi:hypothetical protein GCM10028803_29680 [Larkinella knui]|uniref:ScyD/ScyE family protein n=1 Tax=Larkinella knui TaxID=2025310 RepID=A0A3P1CXP4_9BACT|nr:ScyD/ScyE family protein [Larkinella knui]RRB17999.1 ScyD/ScyE family protein [Larkinella knui]